MCSLTTVWKNNFNKYLTLVKKYKAGLIISDFFIDEFFNIFNKDQEFIKNFEFTSEVIKKIIINSKSFGFLSILKDLSIHLSHLTENVCI